MMGRALGDTRNLEMASDCFYIKLSATQGTG